MANKPTALRSLPLVGETESEYEIDTGEDALGETSNESIPRLLLPLRECRRVL